MNSNQSSGSKPREEEELIDPFILNMDCWLLICQHLTLRDILNLSKLSTAYKEFVGKYVLPARFKSLKIPIALHFNNDIEFVLESVRNTVKKISLLCRFNGNRIIQPLTRFVFPCVTALDLPGDANEDDIYDLSRAFPNVQSLTYFTTCGALKSLMQFKHLEDLRLTSDDNMDVCDFEDMLIALNLKTLVLDLVNNPSIMYLKHEAKRKLSQIHNLKLNCYELHWLTAGDANDVTNDAIVFKNLIKLVVYINMEYVQNLYNLFRDMESIVDRDVYEIEIHADRNRILRDIMLPEKYDFLNRVDTLKFVLANITFEMPGAPNRYKELRELYFYKCHAESWEVILLNIFSNAQELDLLSFERCAMPNILQDKYLRVLMVRKKPITLNCFTLEKLPLKFCSEKYRGLIKFTQKPYIRRNYWHGAQSICERFISIKFRS